MRVMKRVLQLDESLGMKKVFSHEGQAHAHCGHEARRDGSFMLIHPVIFTPHSDQGG